MIQRAVHALTALTRLGLLDRKNLLDIVLKVSPLLCHPSTWIRNEAVNFVASMSEVLGSVRCCCAIAHAC